VLHDTRGDGAHVLGRDVGAVAQESHRAGGQVQVDRGARAGAVLHELAEVAHAVVRRVARSHYQFHDVLLDALVYVEFVEHLAGREDALGREHRLGGLGRAGAGLAAHDLQLVLLGGVVDLHFQHEAIHLRFGERVGPFLLDGILRGQHQKGRPEAEGLLTDGHLPLLHRLQQRRLHLRRRAVDLIGEDDVGKDRPLVDEKVPLLLVVDEGPQEVGGQEVGGELDALEVRPERAGEGTHRERLGQARHTLQKHVPVGEEPDQEALDHVALPDDHAADFVEQLVGRRALFFDTLFDALNVERGHRRAVVGGW